ncbi:MAG TPA: hypothetical protein VGM03_18850 [Phycisphaerae bacterium]|jgi:hypothetical protein
MDLVGAHPSPRWLGRIALALLSAIAASNPAAAQPADLQALVQQALDQPMHVAITDTRVTDAFQTIERESGVKINIDQDCLEMLPYGAETKVNAELRNIPLRQGLGALLASLGMSFEIRDHGLEVVPMPALARLGRRATFDELKVLGTLSDTRWVPGGAGLETFRDRIQFNQVPEKDPWAALLERVQRVGAGKASEVLTLACKSLGWVWYPSGHQIVVMPEAKQVERQLDHMIAVRMLRRPLVEVLQELGRRAGVRIRIEPEAQAALPASTRQNFSLMIENASGRDALDRIAATTGLAWRIDADAVVLFQPGGPASRTAESAAADRVPDPVLFLLSVSLPDGRGVVQIPVRESDVSPELRRFRDQKIDEFNRSMQELLKTHASGERP